MPSKPGFVRRVFRKFALPVALLLAVVSVAADGPVSQIAGVTKTNDTDSGSGEKWGRIGGREITYTVGNTSAFAALSWGSVAGQPPSAAFDNSVDSPGEVLTLDPASDLAGGIARWTGTAVVPLVNQPSISVPTQFMITVFTNGNQPVPLSMAAGGATPGLNLKLVDNFTVFMSFHAYHAGVWQPLLDFYDSMPTPPGNQPGQGGPVLTSFTSGFYFANAGTGLTLDQHDANITQRLNSLTGQAASIKDDTAFMRIDAINRLASVQNSVGQVQDRVGQVQNGVNQLTTMVQNIPGSQQLPTDLARTHDVKDAKDSLQQMLMILFGLAPCPPEAQGLCDNAQLINDLATQVSVDEIRQALSALATQTTVDQANQQLGALGMSVVNLEQILIGLSKESSVQEVKAALGGLASHMGVEQVKQRLNELGVEIAAIKNTINQPAAASLAVQVAEVDEDESDTRRWLVSTSLNGTPVTAGLTKLVVVSSRKRGQSAIGDVTSLARVKQLMPGLLEVEVEIHKQKLSDLSFMLNLQSAGAAPVRGTTLVAATAKGHDH